jgi:hypothetical protein
MTAPARAPFAESSGVRGDRWKGWPLTRVTWTSRLPPGGESASSLRLGLEAEKPGLGNPFGISALRHREVGAIYLSPRSSISPGVFF